MKDRDSTDSSEDPMKSSNFLNSLPVRSPVDMDDLDSSEEEPYERERNTVIGEKSETCKLARVLTASLHKVKVQEQPLGVEE